MDELEIAKSTILSQQFIIQHLTKEVEKGKKEIKCAIDAHDELVEYMLYEGYSLCNRCGVWVNEEEDESIYVDCVRCEETHAYCDDECFEDNWCTTHDMCKPHPIDWCYQENHLLLCECFTSQEIQDDIAASGHQICEDCMSKLCLSRLFEDSEEDISDSDE